MRLRRSLSLDRAAWLSVSATALLVCSAPIADGAAFVGTGEVEGTNLWGTPENWNPPQVPNAVGAVATFGTPTANRTAFVDGNYTVGEITFDNASAFANRVQNNASSTAPSLTLDGTSGSALIRSLSTGAGLNTLGATMVWDDSVTAELTGNLTMSGAVSGPGGFTKTGAGHLTLSGNLKSYLGPTVLEGNSERTRITADSSITNSTSVRVKDGATFEPISDGTFTFGSGSLFLNGQGRPQFQGTIRPDRLPNVGGRVITITNPIVLETDASFHSQTITSASNPNAINTGSITLANVVSGPGNLAFTSPNHNQELGALVLNGDNTYSGGTLIRGGTVVVGGSASASLGTGDVVVISAHAVFPNSSAKLTIQSGVLDAIADSATLSLAGGNVGGVADDGYVQLQAGVNEIVGGLVLGSVPQQFGTYGSTLSGANFKNNEYFSGEGIITVIPEPAAATALFTMIAVLAAHRGARRSRC